MKEVSTKPIDNVITPTQIFDIFMYFVFFLLLLISNSYTGMCYLLIIWHVIKAMRKSMRTSCYSDMSFGFFKN